MVCVNEDKFRFQIDGICRAVVSCSLSELIFCRVLFVVRPCSLSNLGNYPLFLIDAHVHAHGMPSSTLKGINGRIAAKILVSAAYPFTATKAEELIQK